MIFILSLNTNVGQGHVMHILPRHRTNATRVQLSTQYLITKGYCVELYHMVSGSAVLTVKTRGEDYIERSIAAATMETKVIAPIQPSETM